VTLGCCRAGPVGIVSGRGCWWFGAFRRAAGDGGGSHGVCSRAESAAIEPPPTTAGETTDTPLLRPAEVVVVAPTPSVVGAVEGVVGGAGPFSPQPAAAAMEEVLTDKIRIPLRSASVRTPHLFHHGIPKVLVNPQSKGITSVQSTSTH
jgi:hypothetical protein